MTPRFPDPIRVEYAGVDAWILLEPFRYQTAAGETITVPAGFTTDFASIPRPLWGIYPPAGPWAGAAVVHDYLYIQGDRTRKSCDALFLEAMGVLGVPWLRRHLMWSAVRVGGGIPWEIARQRQREQEAFLLELRTGQRLVREKE